MNDTYELKIAAARARFDQTPALATLLSPDVRPELLEAFLIQFCAVGVQMTEPVDGWIRRAGARCRELGFLALGDALVLHAKHEAGHHELMIADVGALVTRWNGSGRPPLSEGELLERPPTPGVLTYRRLHEETIAGPAPFGQLAIELEIERLSLTHGARLIAHCGAVLGEDVLALLTFVTEHVALDAGHTEFNTRQLDAFLTAHREHVGALVEAGGAALEAYGAFLEDCLALAHETDRG